MSKAFKILIIVLVAVMLVVSVSCAGNQYAAVSSPEAQASVSVAPNDNSSIEKFEKRINTSPEPAPSLLNDEEIVSQTTHTPCIVDEKFPNAIKENEKGYMRDLVDTMIDLTNKEREKAGLKPLKKK